MSRTRQSGIGRSRLRLLPLLLTAGILASPAFPARAQANPGPKSPVLSSCVKKVNAAHPLHDDGKSVPPDRLQALSKGVNLTDVFVPSMSTARVSQDIAQLRSLGLRHARIPLDPSWVISWRPDGKPDARLARLDDTVCSALSSGLAVILDMHPEDSLALKDTAPPDNVDALALAWDRLATRYAAFTPDLMFFEALNEPTFSNAAHWDRAQQVLLAHIREAAPHHTILLTATPDSTAGALAGLAPVDDADVAYVFHFYSPMVFTHQGADWASHDLGSIRGLVYPAEPGNAGAVRDRAAVADEKPLANYLASYANAHAIQAEIDVATRWAASHDAHLVVTEFGVYRAVAPQAARVAWLRDVRKALEARSIGWTVWEYRGGFGIDGELSRGCGSEQSASSALGLCGPGKTRAGGEGGSMRANLGMATLPTWPGTARADRRAAGCAASLKGLRVSSASGPARFAVRT